jgi:hypothetical protein
MLRRSAGIAALGFLIVAGSAEAHPRHRGHKHRHSKHCRHEHTVVVRDVHYAGVHYAHPPVVCAPVIYHRVWRPGYWHTATSGVQFWVPGAMVVVNF